MAENMFIVEKEEAKDLLNPFAQDFYDAISTGLKNFAETQSNNPVYESHTKAVMLWDYILQQVKRVVLKYTDSVRLERTQRMYFIVIKDKIALRFKKFDENYKSSNIKTKQVNRFRNRAFKFRKSYLFPVEMGWQVDEFYNITSVDFVSPNGTSYAWRIPFRQQDRDYSEIFPLEENESIQVVTLNKEAENEQKAS